ncbi:gamma-glutamyltransferase [Pandoraea terrae]|uniref:Gamma-glutamyltransferase n=1 Tax=Pandoraea terrae TaxID=1537710 RepID=A0A5E4U2T7_9BURK|nr:gamma-glutamyltransferase [Pandoraea terrae]VVD94031.1 gamma-glutamyltransferase [Pandoraea terrae]
MPSIIKRCDRGHAVVATSDPLATQAAMAVLDDGGNAIDAALCASMVLAVTLPMSSGIGGDGVMLFWDAKLGRAHVIEGLGRAPGNVAPIRQFLRKRGASARQRMPPLAASLPALPWVWRLSLPFLSRTPIHLAQAAMRLAADGFVPDEKCRRWMFENRHVCENDAYLQEHFGPWLGMTSATPEMLADKPLRQPALTAFLESFSWHAGQNDDAWERPFFESAVRANQQRGGAFAVEDFRARPQATLDSPIHLSDRDLRVFSSAGTTPGYLCLQGGRIFSQCERDWAMLGDGERIVAQARVLHQLHAQRRRFVHDHGNDCHAWLMRRLTPAGIEEVARDACALDFHRPTAQRAALCDGDTTYFHVVDAAGNGAACIQSLSLAFGCGVAVPETGAILNARLMRGLSAAPGANNPLYPFARPLNTIFPLLAIDTGGRLRLVAGTAGGDLQVQLGAHLLGHFLHHRRLDMFRFAERRWKYSPVADPFDRIDGPPCIDTAFAPTPAELAAVKAAGLQCRPMRPVGGSLKAYAVDDQGTAALLDEGLDGGSTLLHGSGAVSAPFSRRT